MQLQLVFACFLAAATFASFWYVPGGPFANGRSAAHVWLCAWITAITTGLGALPMLWLKKISEWWLGMGNAVAAGMMTAASLALLSEGVDLPGAPFKGVAAGVSSGAVFIVASQRLLEHYEDVKLAVLDVVDARKALLLVLVMTLHSFSEGIGIGVSFGGKAGSHLGLMISTTLAIHNVPEGFAVAVVLVSRGMSVLGATLWCITTSLPQPLMAWLAFRFVDTFEPIQPVGLGFAAGAMLYVAWAELFAEATEACGLKATAVAGLFAGSTMWLCHEYLL